MKRGIFTFLTSIIILAIFLQDGDYFNAGVAFTSFAISIWSVIAIFNSRNLSFSLYKMFHTFSLLFFGISPYLQYINGVKFWKVGSAFTAEDYLVTNLILLFCLLIFEVVYKWGYGTRTLTPETSKKVLYTTKISLPLTTKLLLLVLSAVSVLTTLISYDFNLLKLFLRGSDLFESPDEVTPLDHIVTNFFRPLSIFVFTIYFYYTRSWDFFSIIFLLVGLFCNFPTGLARYNVAALYIPMFLAVIPSLRYGFRFNVIMILGFLVVFPLLNTFRTFSKSQAVKIGFDFEMFTEGHFDSYSSLLRVIKYNMITYGDQLLGVIFFWVPRKFWPEKARGSGAYMAKELNLYYDNLAMNYYAEGYLNFGIYGLILFAVALPAAFAFFDRKFIENLNTTRDFSILYFTLVGFSIFLLRGDLQSSTAYLLGFLCMVFFLMLVIRLGNKKFTADGVSAKVKK